MKPEAQRIAIAEACGWTRRLVPPTADNLYGEFQHTWWKRPTDGAEPKQIPDYLNDLNAMHEAEGHAYETQPTCWMKNYEEALCEVCSRAQYPSWNIWHATAAQRAESLLRTLNLWTD